MLVSEFGLEYDRRRTMPVMSGQKCGNNRKDTICQYCQAQGSFCRTELVILLCKDFLILVFLRQTSSLLQSVLSIAGGAFGGLCHASGERTFCLMPSSPAAGYDLSKGL